MEYKLLLITTLRSLGLQHMTSQWSQQTLAAVLSVSSLMLYEDLACESGFEKSEEGNRLMTELIRCYPHIFPDVEEIHNRIHHMTSYYVGTLSPTTRIVNFVFIRGFLYAVVEVQD